MHWEKENFLNCSFPFLWGLFYFVARSKFFFFVFYSLKNPAHIYKKNYCILWNTFSTVLVGLVSAEFTVRWCLITIGNDLKWKQNVSTFNKKHSTNDTKIRSKSYLVSNWHLLTFISKSSIQVPIWLTRDGFVWWNNVPSKLGRPFFEIYFDENVCSYGLANFETTATQRKSWNFFLKEWNSMEQNKFKKEFYLINLPDLGWQGTFLQMSKSCKAITSSWDI